MTGIIITVVFSTIAIVLFLAGIADHLFKMEDRLNKRMDAIEKLLERKSK